MTTYYVRKSGNDGNDGDTPAGAWLTIDKAANEVAAGDTVYIGSGVYRELVTMDTSGSSGNQISYIGDVDGVQTGDPGLVIITAHDTETGNAARASCLDCNDQTFIVWQNLICVGGSSTVIDATSASNWAMEGWEFLDCCFMPSENSQDYCVRIDVNAGATPATSGFIFRRCTLGTHIAIDHDNNASAHINLKATIENCLFLRPTSACVYFNVGTSSTYSIGGVTVRNCFGFNGYMIFCENIKNTDDPVTCYNCFVYTAGTFAGATGSTQAAIVEDYNMGSRITTWSSGVTNGGNSDSAVSAPLLGGICDNMLRKAIGWSPYAPWQPIRLLDGTYSSPGVEAATATYAPAEDLYNNPRPMGRNADDVGPVEANPRISRETGTVRTGANSGGFIRGAGYLDKLFQVDAGPAKVEVYARYDGNYTGDLPIMEIYNIPTGVADTSDAMTGGSGSWEKLECTFTATEAGWVRIRLRSRDTSADGECFFDDLRLK